jgi:hypothetical protein
VGGEADWAQGGGHARVELAEPDWGQGGGQGFEAAGSQLGRHGRLGEPVLGQGGAARVAARSVPAGAAVVVVEEAVVGGVGAGRAKSALGNGAASPPESIETDKAGFGPWPACDTATSASTNVTVVSATISALGDRRLTQRRCTDLTSSPPVRKRGRPHGTRPQPVRLSHLSLAARLVAGSVPDQPVLARNFLDSWMARMWTDGDVRLTAR